MSYHEPVMVDEVLQGLCIQPDGVYVDATFGGGGHARHLLSSLSDKGRLIAFDQDEDASANLPEDKRLEFVPHNFRYLKKFLRLLGIRSVNGILADLGVSSHQFDVGSRGFSYRFDHALDMRMNQQESTTAAKVLNTYSQEALQEVFSRYGEVRNSRSLAQHLVTERNHREIKTVGDLLSLIEPLVRGQRQRYLSQVFQALRIEVNDEMGALEEFLDQSFEMLVPGGRLVVISYHSLEDRMVKHFLKTGNSDGELEQDDFGNIYRPFKVLSRKALEPSPEEIARNPRARSAKLRIGEKQE